MANHPHLGSVRTEERLLTRVELAELLGCHPWTVDKMREDGMPSIVWGVRFVRFRLSACIAWLERQDRKAA